LKQQTKMVETQIDAFASRLHAAAGATGLKDLVDTQVRLIPKHASRFVGDARETLNIIAGAGQEVGTLLKGTVAELRGVSKSVVKKATVKKATAKKATAKKAAAKAAPKKTTAKKVAAKKPAAKKAAPKTVAPKVTETVIDVIAESKAA
jgi:phasin family protein